MGCMASSPIARLSSHRISRIQRWIVSMLHIQVQYIWSPPLIWPQYQYRLHCFNIKSHQIFREDTHSIGLQSNWMAALHTQTHTHRPTHKTTPQAFGVHKSFGRIFALDGVLWRRRSALRNAASAKYLVYMVKRSTDCWRRSVVNWDAVSAVAASSHTTFIRVIPICTSSVCVCPFGCIIAVYPIEKWI